MDEAPCPCGHPWPEHDAMGDCHHPDARTLTGYCERCRQAPLPPLSRT